jgi:LmbE family N-acetylglucosaminyl deacetylase
MNILIIAAHPDDEILGRIHLCIVTDGKCDTCGIKDRHKKRKESTLKASKFLGIQNVHFLNFPDMKLDIIPQIEINKKLEELIKKIKPEIVYTVPDNDFHKDHQKVLECTLVVTRPHSSNVKEVYMYEMTESVKTSFNPNVYVNIENEFKHKIKAFRMYTTEQQEFPYPRSLKGIESLAIQRGIEAGLKKAEAFTLVRKIEK